jgi:hypothetical protein
MPLSDGVNFDRYIDIVRNGTNFSWYVDIVGW